MTIAVEFGSRDDANAARNEFADHVCPVDDDRRFKTVQLVSDTPDSVLDAVRARAEESRAERDDSIGQSEFTESERDRIDFSGDMNVLRAQSIKALAERHNVSDWTSHLDETLTVDEHRQIMREAGREGGGARDDMDQLDAERQADAARRTQSDGCDHARDHCEHGDQEACEFLKTTCGFDDSEVNRLLAATDGGRVVDDQDDLVTVGEGDESMRVRPEVAGALSRSWQGYRSGMAAVEDALDQLDDAWSDAQAAARAINEIRDEHGQGMMHFDALEGAQADLLDFLRDAAGDCHECHADHSDHDHPVTAGDRESITEAIRAGVAETPVGMSSDAELPPSAELADLEPDETRPNGRRLLELADQDDTRSGPVRRDQAEADRRLRSFDRLDVPETLGPLSLESADDDELHYADGTRNLWAERVALGQWRVSVDAPSTSFQQSASGPERALSVAETVAEAIPETEQSSTPSFDPERQQSLGVGVEAQETPQDTQVTLTGTDTDESMGALPADWNETLRGYEAGELHLAFDDEDGDTFDVTLSSSDQSETLAEGLQSQDQAEVFVDEFVARVDPADVSFHNADETVPTAAAEATGAAADATDNGLGRFA